MMLSRVAASLYWLGRYVERAENTARVVSVNAHLLLDLPAGVQPDWKPLIDIVGANEEFEAAHEDYAERKVMRFLLGERTNRGSVLSSLDAARETARTIRDAIPRDLWELINELHLFARDNLNSGLGARGRDRYLRDILRGAQTFSGVFNDVMRHDQGYHFARLGRLLERADMTTRIVDVRTFDLLPADAIGAPKPAETVQWVSVLHSIGALQTYRRVVQPRVRRVEVLRFVLGDEDFPRSLYYCITRADAVLAQLPSAEPVRRQTGRTLRTLAAADVSSLARDMPALHEFIDDLQIDISSVHSSVVETYFEPEAPAAEPD